MPAKETAWKVILIMIAAVAVAVGCSKQGLKGDGKITTENRTTSAFTALHADGDYHIRWTPGPDSLTVIADENLLPHIITETRRGTLTIRSAQPLAPSKHIEIHVSSSKLDTTRLAGSMNFSATKLSGKSLKIETAGAVKVKAEGTVDELTARMAGASHLDAKALKTSDAEVRLVGASQADVSVEENLRVSIDGAGTLNYSGNPKVNQSINGFGRINQR